MSYAYDRGKGQLVQISTNFYGLTPNQKALYAYCVQLQEGIGEYGAIFGVSRAVLNAIRNAAKNAVRGNEPKQPEQMFDELMMELAFNKLEVEDVRLAASILARGL